MTTDTATEETRRAELRRKIEAAEARNELRSFTEQAKAAQESATQFVKERPFTAIAGVAVLGLAIGAMFPAGRKAARDAGRTASKAVSSRATSLATIAAELAAVYGSGMLDAATNAAQTSQDKLEDIGESVGTTARGLKRDAAYRAESASDGVRTLTRRAGRKTTRAIRDLRSRAGA